MDEDFTGTPALSKSEPGSNGLEVVLLTPQNLGLTIKCHT